MNREMIDSSDASRDLLHPSRTRPPKKPSAGFWKRAVIQRTNLSGTMPYLRRIKGKFGQAEGITSASLKLAPIVHGIIKSQQLYYEKEAFKIIPQGETRRRKALEKQAAALGLTLHPAAPEQMKLLGRVNERKGLLLCFS